MSAFAALLATAQNLQEQIAALIAQIVTLQTDLNPPAHPVLPASPDGETATPGTGTLTDITGHVFSLNSDGTLMIDGAPPIGPRDYQQPAALASLTARGGIVTAEHYGNIYGFWDNGTWVEYDGWGGAGWPPGMPTPQAAPTPVPAPTPTPTPTPPPTPTPVPVPVVRPVATSTMPASTGTLHPSLVAFIAAMPENSFAEIPGTVIGHAGQNVLSAGDITINDPNGYGYQPGSGGPADTWYAWCSGALDDQRHRLFGGPGQGHLDGFGNACYGCDFEQWPPQWHRIRDDSALNVDADGSFSTTDNTPLPNHNYDGLAVDPETGFLYLFAGFGSPNGQGGGLIWHLDPTNGVWTLDVATGLSAVENTPCMVYSQVLKKFILFKADRMWTFDPATKIVSSAPVNNDFADYGQGETAIDDNGGNWYYGNGGYLLSVSITDPPVFNGDLALRYFGPANDRPVLPLLGGQWDSKRKVLTQFGRSPTTFDPATGVVARYELAPASRVPTNRSSGFIFKKFAYWPEQDVFVIFGLNLDEGIWLFKPGTATPIQMTFNSVTVTNPDSAPQTVNRPTYGATLLSEGGAMTIAAGSFPNGLVVPVSASVSGAGGVTADGNTPLPTKLTGFGMDVGNVVTQGDTTTLSNLEMSGAVDGEDSSGIRHQGKHLTVDGCWSHGNSMNFLSAPISAGTAGGDIVFNGSWFTDSVNGNEFDHNIYVSVSSFGGPASFTMNAGGSLRANGFGHLIKSRALVTNLNGITALQLDAPGSRCVDLPDGGVVTIRKCLLELGTNSDNSDIIGFARELSKDSITAGNGTVSITADGTIYVPDPKRKHSLVIDGCILIFDLQANPHSDPAVVICTNGLATQQTFGGVTIPAVRVSVKNCTIINRNTCGLPLQWTPGIGDPANNVSDDGGNVVIDEVATPGSLVAAGMRPYPWMPRVPV